MFVSDHEQFHICKFSVPFTKGKYESNYNWFLFGYIGNK